MFDTLDLLTLTSQRNRKAVFQCSSSLRILVSMYRSVLSALLFGMVPLSVPALSGASIPLGELAIAPLRAPLEIEEHLSASGVLVVDLEGGQRLYAKQAGVRRLVASLTKLMTALIIVENHDGDEWVQVTKEAKLVDGNNAYLPLGEQFTVSDLLSALLIPSANDAANALAIHHSGSVEAFVREMNTRAESLGLKNTHYANPTGLDSVMQWSTPQDTAWLTTFVLRIPEIRDRLGSRGERIFSRSGVAVDLFHTHELMHEQTAVVAGKTGTTNGAKECLLSVVKQGDREVLVVLLHSEERYKDMKIILDVLEDLNNSEDEEEKLSYLSP